MNQLQFKHYKVTQIPRTENGKADALARLALGVQDDNLTSVPIEWLHEPSVDRAEHVNCT